MSITEVTGIKRIDTLYLQLPYRCNFNCAHCFQGERLKLNDRISSDQATQIMTHFKGEYATSKVVLLGGEPFLHDEVVTVNKSAYDLGLATEICTNGHRVVRRKLPAMIGKLDKLRVSLDGLREAHNQIRAPSSYNDAIETIEFAASLGFRVGVTLTVTSLNVNDLPQLVEELADRHVMELKLAPAPLTPLRRCDHFMARVRFGNEHKPDLVWRISGVPPRALDDFTPNDDLISIDQVGDVSVEFYELRQGLSYGVQWKHD